MDWLILASRRCEWRPSRVRQDSVQKDDVYQEEAQKNVGPVCVCHLPGEKGKEGCVDTESFLIFRVLGNRLREGTKKEPGPAQGLSSFLTWLCASKTSGQMLLEEDVRHRQGGAGDLGLLT